MVVPNIVACFGTARAGYTEARYDVPPEHLEWDDVMVLIAEILPQCYSLVVVRPCPNGTDVQKFASVICDDWLFACDEKERLVKWKTPERPMWARLKFGLVEDFWLFVGQFAEARTHTLRNRSESSDQLNAMVNSFRTFFVVATTMNTTNAFDGRPDPDPVRFGDDVAADSSGDESS